MQAAQHRCGYDFSCTCRVTVTVSSWNALSNALMRPRAIVVIGVLLDHAAQLVSMKDEHMVKAFAFQASDATLADSVRFWCFESFFNSSIPVLLATAVNRLPYFLSRS